MLAQVERFEDYCLKKRRLEGDVESVLTKIDEKAMGAVGHAECELENTKRECAEIEARVERARRGDFDRAEVSRFPLDSGPYASQDDKKDGGAPQTSGSNTQLALAAPNEPNQPDAVIEPSSPMQTFAADSDGFSVVSTQHRGLARVSTRRIAPTTLTT